MQAYDTSKYVWYSNSWTRKLPASFQNLQASWDALCQSFDTVRNEFLAREWENLSGEGIAVLHTEVHNTNIRTNIVQGSKRVVLDLKGDVLYINQEAQYLLSNPRLPVELLELCITTCYAHGSRPRSPQGHNECHQGSR